MKRFPLSPPAKELNADANAMKFQGGMTPIPTKGLSMIVLDVRSLGISLEEGKRLEKAIRTLLLQKLSKKVKNLKDLPIADLHSSVLGISFD